jgi:phosphoribosylglycinamide formyltransferase-1
MKRIVILASGSGSNAENIIGFFQTKKSITVTHVLTNNQRAKVLDRCERLKVNSLVFDKKDFVETDKILDFLKKEADFIVLAGFLWRVPSKIVEAFPDKIINIHPALLPKYGGKGMYGMNVHAAVKENKEKESGITIHFVNEQYDEGAIIFQARTDLNEEDTAMDIASKVHELEYLHFPSVIEKVITEQSFGE